MSDIPVKSKMTLYSNAVQPYNFSIDTDEESTVGWTFQGYLYEDSAPSTPVITLTVSWDDTSNTGEAVYDPADVDTELGEAEKSKMLFVILGKPGTDYPIIFFYGAAELKQGGPPWT